MDKSGSMLKGIAKAIKEYASIQSDRAKITGDVLVNQIKEKQNFFYKMQEMQAKGEMDLQGLKAKSDLDWQNKQKEYDYMRNMNQGGDQDYGNQFISALEPSYANVAGGVGGEQTGMRNVGGVSTPTWSPATPEIDMAKLVNPANRQRYKMTASGVSSETIPIEEAYYNSLLRIEKRRPLNEREQKQKNDLERNMFKGEKITDIQRKAEEEKALRLAKGITPDKAGLASLAKESIKNIQDVKEILFPDGTAKSFKRTTAFAANLPGGSLPILPSRGWGKSEQEVFRKMGSALSGRQLIQTGVAARPEETQKLVSQFSPSGGSNPEAALNGLNELEDFYKNYLNTLTTGDIGLSENKLDSSLFTPENISATALKYGISEEEVRQKLGVE